jgi:hypothetical protein
MSNKFIVKAISIAVAIAISSPSFALPTGNDFPRKMPMTAYMAKSMASDEDLEKMALKFFNSTSIQNPFTVVNAQLQKEFREQQIGRLSSGDYIGYQTKSDQSLAASAVNKYKMQQAGSISAEKLEKILGAPPPMDMWLPSYITRFLAATYVGGRVVPTWPSNANPLYGSLTGTNNLGEAYWQLNSESPLYNEYKDRKESRFFGRNRYAEFPRLPSSVFDGDIENARILMQNTVIALFYTNMVAELLINSLDKAPEEKKGQNEVSVQSINNKVESNLFRGLDRQEALLSVDMGIWRQPLPSDSTYEAEWAHDIFGNVIGSTEAIDKYKSGAAYIEKAAADMVYIPLSKAGEPIKFLFKPSKMRKLRWALVEFTKKGLEVKTLQDAEREFPIIKNISNSLLALSFTCREELGNRCFDYGFGNFDSGTFGDIETGRVAGVRRWIIIPKTLKTKTELVVDALEEASQQLPDSSVPINKGAEMQLPKPGEKIDFWGLGNQAK